jgi:anti-anti-sigma factor
MKHVRIEHHGDVVVVTPHGYLVGGDETDQFGLALLHLGEQGALKVVVNLIETDHMNSLALGVLIAAREDFADRGARIRLCHLNDRIQNALVVTKLGLEFDVHGTEREAVESFRAGVSTTD